MTLYAGTNTSPSFQYVVKGNTFEVKVRSEKNQRVILAYSYNGGIRLYNTLSGVVDPLSCTLSSPTSVDDPTTDGGLIEKFAQVCETKYSFVFPSSSGQATGADGSSPSDSYTFNLYAVDLGGNLAVVTDTINNTSGFTTSESGVVSSLHSENYAGSSSTSFIQSTSTPTEQVFHDRKSPIVPEVSLSSLDSNSPLTGNTEQTSESSVLSRGITKSLSVLSTHGGEGRSDLDYSWSKVRDSNNNVLVSPSLSTRLLLNGFKSDGTRNMTGTSGTTTGLWNDKTGDTPIPLGGTTD
jgi:hypothetical protein